MYLTRANTVTMDIVPILPVLDEASDEVVLPTGPSSLKEYVVPASTSLMESASLNASGVGATAGHGP